MHLTKTKKSTAGFTLFIAVVVMNLLILVAFAIIDISLKEVLLSSSGRDSQFAFYAADSGVECALYWDSKDSTVFARPGETAGIQHRTPVCNAASNWDTPTPPYLTNPTSDTTYATSTFKVIFYPDEGNYAGSFRYCAKVDVVKKNSPTAENPNNIHVSINSYGYNTCSDILRRIERAIKVEYDQ
jgi:hypothetical protein